MESYASLGFKVMADPFNSDVTERAISALRKATPFSIIRIGDGEANLLSFARYAGTPNLDRYTVAALVNSQQDSIVPDELWMLVLRDMMLSSVLQADIVGIIGLWRPVTTFNADKMVDLLRRDSRGGCGHWRSMDYMLRLAREGFLQGKTIASAHLYFGVIQRIDEILSHAKRILLITDKTRLEAAFAGRFPGIAVELLSIGKPQAEGEAHGPQFLVDVEKGLPHDMRGYCCLIGAGPWAEIYCGWIKQRGGVAIDIGSGFDLLDGKISRPIHNILGLDKINKYALEE
jgi:hypothetical protein